MFGFMLPSFAQEISSKITKIAIEPEVDPIMAVKWQDEFKHVEYPKQWLDT